jgi:hypothetical protein
MARILPQTDPSASKISRRCARRLPLFSTFYFLLSNLLPASVPFSASSFLLSIFYFQQMPSFFVELKRRNIWGAHAPSRAGDGALAIANFVSFSRGGPLQPTEVCFGEAPRPARQGARAPRNVISASRVRT